MLKTKKRKWEKFVAFCCTILLTLAPVHGLEQASAATKKAVTLSSTSLTLTQGKTTTLKVLNATSKPVFKSQNTSIVSATKYTGTLRAKNVGSTTVTATLKNGKKYVCKVKVVFGNAKVLAADETLTSGKELAVNENASLTLPTGWDYEQFIDNEQLMQYICINLPDDEYKGCIYVNSEPYNTKENIVMKDYTASELKQLVAKMQKTGYTVQWASTGVTTIQDQEVGVMTFWVKNGTTMEYETVLIQQKGSYLFTIECIGRSKLEQKQFTQAALYMLQTLTVK